MLTHDDREKIALLLSLVNDHSQPNINALAMAISKIDLMALNLKAFGYELARQLHAALPMPQATSARHVGLGWKPSVQRDLETDWAAHWARELHVPIVYHRKLWELVYVLQCLYDAGRLTPGQRGIGFGCGSEPMGSYFASLGVHSLITDQPLDMAQASGWNRGNEHAASPDPAFHPQLVDRGTFDAHVTYRPVDMNAIPRDLAGFDFCWSICALEHLGTLARGLAFIERALETLRRGGTAVHTTELNINEHGPTIDNWPSVLFQRRHFEALAASLRAKGHAVGTLDFNTGDQPMDHFIDLPPWHDGTWEQISRGLGAAYHMKLGVDGFVATCYGLVITKAG